jgi:hypothetical protein
LLIFSNASFTVTASMLGATTITAIVAVIWKCGITLLKSNTKQQECIHHWMIDPPHGLMSYGKCKFCGAVAEFSNALVADFARGMLKTDPGINVDNLPVYHPD